MMTQNPSPMNRLVNKIGARQVSGVHGASVALTHAAPAHAQDGDVMIAAQRTGVPSIGAPSTNSLPVGGWWKTASPGASIIHESSSSQGYGAILSCFEYFFSFGTDS